MRLSTASSPKPPSKGLSLGRIFLSEDFIFVSFGFLAFFILYSLQVVLSVTIVSMVRTPILLVQNSTNSNSTNATSTKPLMRNPNAEFDWSEQLRGVILGSYFWGYASTQLPGGYLAEKYGSKHIMAGSVLITSILTIVSPWAARFSYIAFIACRILEGMFEGVAYPAMHSMIAKWFDKSHRGSMSTIIYIGAQFGTVFTMCVTGILIHSEILGGWPAPFYLLGVLGILWTIGWSLWVKEEPTRIISICELELVQETPNTPGTPGRSLQPPPEEPQKKTPWKQIFTSVPVWALVIAHFGQSWGYFTLLLQLPSYFDRVLGFHIKKNGLLSAVPYLGQAITGCLASYFFDGGWPSVFYVSGVVGIIWFIAWNVFVYETPADDPRISNSELTYILTGQNTKKKSETRKIPYKAIFTSLPVWAIIIANIGQSWGYFTLLLQLPSYFENVLGFNLKKNGLLSATPYALQVIGGWSSSYVSDRVLRSQRFETTTLRKIWNTIGHVGPAICLFLVTVVKCNTTANVILFCLALFLNSFMYSGYHVAHVDMAPDFAGILMGLSNGAGSVAAFIAPYLVSVFTQNGSNLQTWAYVFYISSAIYTFGAIVFVVFGSSKLQKWAVVSDASTENGAINNRNE